MAHAAGSNAHRRASQTQLAEQQTHQALVTAHRYHVAERRERERERERERGREREREGEREGECKAARGISHLLPIGPSGTGIPPPPSESTVLSPVHLYGSV